NPGATRLVACRLRRLTKSLAMIYGFMILVPLELASNSCGDYRVRSRYLVEASKVEARRQHGRLKIVAPRETKGPAWEGTEPSAVARAGCAPRSLSQCRSPGAQDATIELWTRAMGAAHPKLRSQQAWLSPSFLRNKTRARCS